MKTIEHCGLDRLEVPVRAWSDHDPEAAAVVKDVYRQRFRFVRGISAEMGLDGADAWMRARLWLGYATHGKSMYGKATRRKQAEYPRLCHEVLTCTGRD